MSRYGSIGNWPRETSYSSSHHSNDNGISDYVSNEVSTGDGRSGFRSQDTSQY